MQPTLTIVIPTYGRRSALFDTLASLETMEGRESTEIVVVDDGSPDDTWRFLESWMSPKDGRRAFRQENAGVLAARNRGSLEASAPVILFMDDDIEPPADLVVRYTALMELHSDSWISGPYRLPEFAPETPFEQFLEQTLQEWDAAYPEHPTRDGNQPLGGNLCVRREEFRAIGGFDESLRMGGEELDLVLRARGRGIHLRYDPSVGVIHHESHRTLESFVARKRRYSAASLELWRRYGEETGLSERIRTHAPPPWGRGDAGSRLRRAVYRGLAAPVGNAALRGAISLGERGAFPRAGLHALYRLAIGSAMTAGTRDGLLWARSDD